MSNSRRSRHSNLSQGLNLSLEQLKQWVRQLGLAERLVKYFFFLAADVRAQRKSFGVEDLPLFLSNGQRVDLKSVEEVESALRTEYGRVVFCHWLTISGKKVEVFSYNQILDEKFCFDDGEFISDPAILHQELSASLAITQNPDLSETELESDQMDVDEVNMPADESLNIPADEMNHSVSSTTSNQNWNSILKNHPKIDEDSGKIEELVENEELSEAKANQEHRNFLNQYNQDDEEEIEEEVEDPSEETFKKFSKDDFFENGNENINNGVTSFDNDNAMQGDLLSDDALENQNSTSHNAKQNFSNFRFFSDNNTISYITHDKDIVEKNRNKKS